MRGSDTKQARDACGVCSGNVPSAVGDPGLTFQRRSELERGMQGPFTHMLDAT